MTQQQQQQQPRMEMWWFYGKLSLVKDAAWVSGMNTDIFSSMTCNQILLPLMVSMVKTGKSLTLNSFISKIEIMWL